MAKGYDFDLIDLADNLKIHRRPVAIEAPTY
jgi:hypothetical protein